MEWISPEFIAQNGIGVFAFIVMAWLFVRQQNMIKETEAGHATTREAETAQQNKILQQNANIIQMYVRFDTTLKTLDDTLKAAFGQLHSDREAGRTATEEQTAGINALTTKIGNLETTMSTHTESTPSIQDLITAIEALGKNVDKNVAAIKEEFSALRSQAEQVKKETQETPTVKEEPEDKSDVG